MFGRNTSLNRPHVSKGGGLLKLLLVDFKKSQYNRVVDNIEKLLILSFQILLIILPPLESEISSQFMQINR